MQIEKPFKEATSLLKALYAANCKKKYFESHSHSKQSNILYIINKPNLPDIEAGVLDLEPADPTGDGVGRREETAGCCGP